MIHFGHVGKPLPDWRAELDDADPDDEQFATPADVTAILGFDPAAQEPVKTTEPPSSTDGCAAGGGHSAGWLVDALNRAFYSRGFRSTNDFRRSPE